MDEGDEYDYGIDFTDITASAPVSSRHGSSLMASPSTNEGITQDLSSIFRLGVLNGTVKS